MSQIHHGGRARIKRLREATVLAIVGTPSPIVDLLESFAANLNLETYVSNNVSMLAPVLETIRPFAVLCGDLREGGKGIFLLSMIIAGFDPCLPVLLMTDGDPKTHRAIDAARGVWSLKDFGHVNPQVSLVPLVDFLSRAGRRCGPLRLMQI